MSVSPLTILLRVLDIFVENKHWSELKPSQIFQILLYTYNKGWLYTPIMDGVIQCAFCAYRIPEVNEETLVQVPLQESGTLLYVPFFVSLNEEQNLYQVIRESLKIYIEQNPDITELVLQDKNETLKRYRIKNGEKDETKEDGVASTADVSN